MYDTWEQQWLGEFRVMPAPHRPEEDPMGEHYNRANTAIDAGHERMGEHDPLAAQTHALIAQAHALAEIARTLGAIVPVLTEIRDALNLLLAK